MQEIHGASAFLSSDSEFEDALFWVCGGSSGIGFSVARALAQRKARLVIMARNEGTLNSAADELQMAGAREVITAPFDLTDPRTPGRALALLDGIASGAPGAETGVRKARLRGLLLNGGGPHGKKATELTWADFTEANVGLLAGPGSLLAALSPRLEHGRGSVVAITSTTVKQTNPALPLSAAYRTGLVALLKTFADELAPLGIRVNNVAPGYVGTEKLGELQRYVAAARHGSEDAHALARVAEEWAALAPLGRIAAPEEIARVCLFLFSRDASFITGQTLVADGGQVRGY